MKKIKGPTYWKADEDIHNLVYRVLREQRPEIDEMTPEIIVIWKDVAEITGGKWTLASIRKVSDKDQITYDSTANFVLQISSNTWQALDGHQREALIYHELLHIGLKFPEGTFIIVKHQLEEFPQVIEQFGFYKNDVQVFVDSVLKVNAKIPESNPVKRYRLSK